MGEVIAVDPDWIDGFRKRTVLPAGDVARSAQAAAAMIPDLSCPSRLSEVGSALAAVREVLSDASAVCAERADLFGGRLSAAAEIFREVEADAVARVRAIEVSAW